MRRIINLRISLYLIALFCVTTSSYGQTMYFHRLPETKPIGGFRFLRPNFDNENDLATITGTMDIFIQMPVGRRFDLVISTPYSIYNKPDYDNTTFFGDIRPPGKKEGSIGDISIGLIYFDPESKGGGLNISATAFFPIAEHDKSKAMNVGLRSDLNNFQRFAPYIGSMDVNVAYHYYGRAGYHLGLEFGPRLSVAFGSLRNSHTEALFMHYGIIAGWEFSPFQLSLEFNGVYAVDIEVEKYGGTSNHNAACGIFLMKYMIRPGVFYQFPLEDDIGIYGVFGFELVADIP